MTTCPGCGAPNDATDRFCGRCGGRLGPASRSPAAGAAPPARLFLYAGLGLLALLVMWGSGFTNWLAGQIQAEIIPSLQTASPFGLIEGYDRGMRCEDFRISWSGLACTELKPSWHLKVGQVPFAFACTIGRVLGAGWPVWMLVFPPLGAGVMVWRRAGLPFSDSLPASFLLGVPVLLLACGLVSWVVQLLLVVLILPVVAQVLLYVGFVRTLYAKWRDISGVFEDLRTAHRFARLGSGHSGRSSIVPAPRP